MKIKLCPMCKVDKSFSDFFKSRTPKSVLGPRCDNCGRLLNIRKKKNAD